MAFKLQKPPNMSLFKFFSRVSALILVAVECSSAFGWLSTDDCLAVYQGLCWNYPSDIEAIRRERNLPGPTLDDRYSPSSGKQIAVSTVAQRILRGIDLFAVHNSNLEKNASSTKSDETIRLFLGSANEIEGPLMYAKVVVQPSGATNLAEVLDIPIALSMARDTSGAYFLIVNLANLHDLKAGADSAIKSNGFMGRNVK